MASNKKLLSMNKIRLIIDNPSLSDSEKIKRIRSLLTYRYISDTGLGYLVRVPKQKSCLFRYSPRSGESYTAEQQAIACREALNQAIQYRDNELNNN